ncbi:porin [Herbaspirillum sp. DW155]|uniref:porin n=1 Tax=Herbaspirillum sp. DW155 TaxID=3095609 RepID=UPI0030891E33|nr:porin [Herbaspirillum sp. DW155]
MKKSTLALALLVSSGAASAQSSVTVYGLMDTGIGYTKSSTTKSTISMDSGNWYGSRIGFKGTEDLGGGLSAEFRLETGFSSDTGALGQGGRLFGRQSWIGINGGFGSVKLGRQWIPAYITLGDIEPFGIGMAGDASYWLGANVFQDIDIRMSNAVNYSFSSHGMEGIVTYGMGETAGSIATNAQLGGSLAYKAGPVVAAITHHQVKDAAGSGYAKTTIFGGSYDFGILTVHAAASVDQTDANNIRTYDRRNEVVGVSVPIGMGKLIADFISQQNKLGMSAHQYALGYYYEISKRTSVYTSYAYENGNKTTKMNAGIKHLF